jgi:ABC-type maltose transport system permease subunit
MDRRDVCHNRRADGKHISKAAESIKIPSFRLGGDLVPTLESFQWVLEQPDFWRGLVNSLIVAGTTVVGVIALELPGAYAFSRYRFKGRDPRGYTFC